MVVDLAVKCDGGVAVVADEGLIAAAQIDNLQTNGAQRSFTAFEDPLLVRPAMVKCFGDAMGDAPPIGLIQTRKARNPTHLEQNPRSERKS